MTKRKYTEILAQRLPQDNEGVRQALEAVCARYELPLPQSELDWMHLALVLMAKHEPEFQEPRKRGGRPPQSILKDLTILLFVYDVSRRLKMSERKACVHLHKLGQIEFEPETLRGRLRELKNKIEEPDPQFLAQLRKERDEFNELMNADIYLKPEDNAKREYSIKVINGAVDIILGGN